MIVDLQTHEQGNSQGYEVAQYQANEKKDEVLALYRDGYQAEAPAQHELDDS